MELREQLSVLRRRWRAVLLVWVVVLAATAGITALMPTRYTATTQLFFGVQGGGSISDLSQGSNYVEQQMSSYVRVATSSLVLTPVIRQLGLDTTSQQLVRSVSASAPLDTVVLEIDVTQSDPDQAARIANAISAQLVTVAGDLTPESSSAAKPVRVTVLEPAVAPDSPSSPQTLLNLAIGFVLGLVAGVAVALVRGALSTRVQSSEDMESLTTAPVIGVIPYDASTRHTKIIMRGHQSSARSEAIRRLRTNFQFLGVSTSATAILVSSSVSGEGKTSTAINLGMSLADSGRRVLVVDADLRHPAVAGQFGLPNKPGLSEMLGADSRPEKAIRALPDTTLDILPAGQLPPDPTELLGSSGMAALLFELKKTYDVILLDSPPLLPLSDALVLSKSADGALLVVGSDRAHKAQVGDALESLETIGANLLGIVLNRVSRRDLTAYGNDDDVPIGGWEVPADDSAASKPSTRSRIGTR